MMRKERRKGIIWGMFFWIILNVCYFSAMQVNWAENYPGEFNLFRFILATLSIVSILLLFPQERELTVFYLYLLLFIVLMPMAVIFVSGAITFLYMYSVLFVFCGVVLLVPRLKPKGIDLVISCGGRQLISRIIVLLSSLYVVITFVLLYIRLGVPGIKAIDVMKVYEIREELSISTQLYNMFQLSSKAIIPFLLAISLHKRNFRAVLILVLIQFCFYLWLANKTTLVSLAVFFLAYYLSDKEKMISSFNKLFSLALLVLSLLEIYSIRIGGSIAGIVSKCFSLFVRRTLFVPAILKSHFYDFFVLKGNPLQGLFGTFVAPIMTRLGVNDPYEKLTYTKVIGEVYSEGANANTGVFGKELAHFGFFGLLVAGLCLVVLFYAVRVCERRNGTRFTSVFTIYIIFSLQDTGAMEILSFTPVLFVFIILMFFDLKQYTSYKIRNELRKKRLISLTEWE